MATEGQIYVELLDRCREAGHKPEQYIHRMERLPAIVAMLQLLGANDPWAIERYPDIDTVLNDSFPDDYLGKLREPNPLVRDETVGVLRF